MTSHSPSGGRPLHFATYCDEANLALDDRPLVGALDRLGFRVTPAIWDSADLPTDGAGLVFRSCWDYDAKAALFERWLDSLEARGVRCVNSVALVRWNFHKRYLLDLAARGATLPPTVLVPVADRRTVAGFLGQVGAREGIVKPAISMLARSTHRLSLDDLEGSEARLALSRARGEVLVQAFVPEIQTQGETSLVFFDGQYSHAVRKRPAAGDFRSQTEYGGTRELASPKPAVVAAAARVLDCLDERPAIARVDGVEVGDALVLMRLELIDPSLFFAEHPAAIERCARVIAQALG